MKQNNFFILLLIAGFTTIMTAQVPSYISTNGLVGYWPFNGNANDVSTNANNGTNNGATLTTDRFGNVNSAYQFNHNSITLINTPQFNGSWSISLWYKRSAYSTGYANFGALFTTSSDIQYYGIGMWLIINENQLYFQAGGENVLNLEQYVYDTNWHNVIYTYDGVNLSLYVDSVNKLSAPVVVTSNYTSSFNIGRGFDIFGNDFSFLGNIDDIGIWNRALTPDEITNLYNTNICYQSVTVTDTLIINLGTLSYNPVTYNNSITIYPNPAKDRITIDCGTLSSVTGYQIKISNLLGQEVFSTTLNQQQYSIPLNSWTGKGIYLVTVYDANRNLLTTRKIDLQ